MGSCSGDTVHTHRCYKAGPELLYFVNSFSFLWRAPCFCIPTTRTRVGRGKGRGSILPPLRPPPRSPSRTQSSPSPPSASRTTGGHRRDRGIAWDPSTAASHGGAGSSLVFLAPLQAAGGDGQEERGAVKAAEGEELRPQRIKDVCDEETPPDVFGGLVWEGRAGVQ